MGTHDGYHLWADAHAFYDSPLIPATTHHADLLTGQTAAWEQRLEATPNGALLRNNALFDALSGDGPLYFLHVTHALEEISEHGFLYPSGGCLVGSIYCAPLTVEGGGFRMHNLAQYVLNKEAPAFVSKVGEGRKPTPLIFEIDRPQRAYRGLAGVDYLRLGSIHLSIYNNLEYLLSHAERYTLREAVVSRVKNSTALLALAAAIAFEDARVAPGTFLKVLDEAIPRLPILGYLYFEALAEYLMLHSRTEQTQRLAQRGEFNNWLYKEALFVSFPDMAGKFDLSKFRPAPQNFDKILARIDASVDAEHARGYLRDRISYLVATRLFTPGRAPESWHRTRWEFDSLATLMGPLLGHLIHRELRTFGRYPDFYFYFDQHKALQAWNYWNHMDIIAPFNGTMPKGEVGINPAYPDLEYRIFRAAQDDAGRVHPVDQLKLTIAPRLVDIKYTLMRNNKWSVPNSTPK
ncbi:hypothetical protein SLNWT_7137 [Streptomyces albus]|uniref:Uncharacterized protein n=1 Tax=Streptomyces albus (strain ATCC 21838 / DSM 41398 / FERM P-419 / JCM 4703 / NBRC 107858) TaxID=1081613 RepID=A0A0B5EXG8_STRA4|nr:hypothetical protein SLNWT_7137 [Streptomyces albus]AOU81817.1 hypothetical protein SLNHY_7126 [Streptomyces albus]AYN37504.1 hypothetical protein DUI70_7011 [Streptomyces albus]